MAFALLALVLGTHSEYVGDFKFKTIGMPQMAANESAQQSMAIQVNDKIRMFDYFPKSLPESSEDEEEAAILVTG